MQVYTTEAELEKLVIEKKWIAESEAKRFWGRFFVKTGTVGYDDILQEAYKALQITLVYFNKSKSAFAALDPYMRLGIRGELTNWVNKTKRQFNVTYDDPSVIENIPEDIQDLMPSMEDIEVILPLSPTALDFLKCVFTPNDDLKAKIRAKLTSGRPYSKHILPTIIEWMGITYEQYNEIQRELREKCVYEPA